MSRYGPIYSFSKAFGLTGEPPTCDTSNKIGGRSDLVAALHAWCNDAAAAADAYGPIEQWDVSAVTDFSTLFVGYLGRVDDRYYDQNHLNRPAFVK